jgi:hypothetical protein
MSQLLKDLEAVKTLLDSPDKWTKGEFARDNEGRVITLHSSDACAFCLSGAAMRVTLNGHLIGHERYTDVREALQTAIGTPIITFNDGFFTTYEEIIEAIDKAISNERSNTSVQPDA